MVNTINYSGKQLMPAHPVGRPPYTGALLANGTYVYGQLLKQSGTPGTFAAIVVGTDEAAIVAICVFDVVVDANGYWHGGQASNEIGASDPHTLVYQVGGGASYRTEDLCVNNARLAIDAAAVTGMGGKLMGTVTAGTVQL